MRKVKRCVVDSPQQVARSVARAAQAGGVSPLAVLPLVAITGLGLLATDLYLPSVPHLPQLLGGTLEQAQFTLSAFMTALAPMQLVYGALADAFGTLRVLLAAILLFIGASLGCATAPSVELLVLFRFLQGAGAAAAAAIVPAVIRTTYNEIDGVRMLSWLGASEAVVPAVGPVLGAGVFIWWGRRATFWILFGCGLGALLILVWRCRAYRGTSSRRQMQVRGIWRNITSALRNPVFLAHAVGHGSAYAALMTFVGAAPYLLQKVYVQGPMAFGAVQIVMVTAFIAGAANAGRVVQAIGKETTMRIGLSLLSLTGLLLLALSLHLLPDNAATLTMAMLPSQVGLGLRGGLTMSAAMGAQPDREASAAALLSFIAFVLAAGGNALVAPFLHLGLAPVVVACVLFCFTSLAAYGVYEATRWNRAQPDATE